MIFEKRENLFSLYHETQYMCPVCGEWRSGMKAHLAKSRSKEHKEFYKKHCETKLVKTIKNLKIE